jgi:tetratricopeptide (TPR) repeat protein
MVDAWQRHRFFEGLAQAFLAVHRPLLLVLDNLQWCDEETFAWISFLLGLAPHNRLMLAMTLRKDEETSYPTAGDWVARLRTGHLVEEIQLGPLDREETATLSAAVTGRALPEDEQVLLHGTTGGFPLYVIEAAQAASGEGFAVRPSEQLGTVLRRRIGQTSRHAQETAGLAAALGSDFTIDVLTEASDLDADTVARSVDELWRRRILRELGSGYDFSHDLLRDAAYEMVSPPRRWLLHRRLAQALELSASGQDESLAGLLAEQYDRGGRPDRALSHYTRAAEVAAGRFASADAIRLHRHALRIIEAQPAGPHRDQQELECLLALAAPLNALHGYASTELRTVLERAVRLAERSGSSRLLVTSLVGLWASRYVQGEILDSLRLVSRALSVSEVDDVLLGEAHFGFAGSAVTLGRPAEAVEHFDQAHDRCRGAESLAVGTMPEVHALAWAAHAHWLLGQWDEAASRADEAVSRARAFAHPYSLAVALAYAAVTEQLLDDRVALGKRVRELDGLSDRYGFAYYREWGLVLGGWLHGGPDGLARAKRGIENLRGQCSLARMPYWLSLQADLMIDCGMTEAAIATLDAARAGAVLRGDAWWLPEVQRVRAGLSAPGMREELLKSALELAERQGSRALADRCRRDLGPAAGMSETPFVTGPSRANAEGTLPS